MTEKQLIRTLIDYGFNEKEARVYLGLVDITEGNITDIAKVSKLPRSTIYHIVQQLEDRGFVSHFRKNNVVHYTPESIHKLITTLHEKEELIADIIPELKKRSRAKQNQSVQVLQGKDGVKAAFEDILASYERDRRPVYAISDIDALNKLLPRFFSNWSGREKEQPVEVFMMVPENNTLPESITSNTRTHTRTIPDRLEYSGDVSVYADKVVFFHLDKKNPHVVVINSPEVADMQRKVLKLLWESVG